MKGYINGFNWVNVSPMKYWSFGSGVSDEAKREAVRNAVFSGDYLGSLKVDGFYQRICKDEDGNIFMIARSLNVKGEIVDKHEWIPQLNSWFESLPNGTCFLTECYLPGMEGSKNVTSVLGCLKERAIARQKDKPLHLYVFDVMAFNGINYNKTPYAKRAEILTNIINEGKYTSPFVEWTQFFDGEKLWAHLQDYLASGREGMVIMRKDAIVYDKRTPARVSIKVKKEVAYGIDCFFTGNIAPATIEYTGKELLTWIYWEDIVTGEKFNAELAHDYDLGRAIRPITKGHYYGWAGSLEIGVLKIGEGPYTITINGEKQNAKIVPIGWLSNLPDDFKANPDKYKMKPIEVTAMELDYSSNPPTLRHGKMKQWREDLTLADCTLDKIV